ncbi:unnamed protein product [Pedinophyceae sp. YPF-701]|nr:unnamed protein product [Pedinophyceae sp. YPF-701]
MAARGKNIDKHNFLIQQLYVRQEFDECLELVEKVLQESQGQCQFAVYTKGMILRQRGSLQESLNMFQMAAALNASDPNNIKQVAKSLHLLGKHEAAIEVYNEVIQLAGRQWDVMFAIGQCYLNLREHESAAEAFKESLSSQQNDQVYMALGKLLTQMGRYDEARALYEEAVVAHPQHPELLTTLGLMHLRTNDNQRALQLLAQSLKLDPKNPRTVMAAASIMQDHSDHDNALIKYRAAAQHSPNSPQVWNNIGMCFFGKQRYVAAVACLKRALYLGPFEWIVSYNLGLVYLNVGQYASAFHFFSAAVNLKPDFAHSYMYLGLALSRLEDFENACLAYEKALELEDDYVFRLNYGIMLARHGHTDMAREQYAAFKRAFDQLDADAKESDADVTQQAELLGQMLK